MQCNKQSSDKGTPVCFFNDPSELPVLETPIQIQRKDDFSRNLKRVSSESPSQMK